MSVAALERPPQIGENQHWAEAQAKAASQPLADIDVAKAGRFVDNTFWPYFERLRREDPVHFCADSEYGPYWSITKYKDIMTVDTDHENFSSSWKHGGITIRDAPEDFQLPMFIAMDPPEHDAQRKVVSPIVAPANLGKLESLIRKRIGKVLDELPRNEPFDWVERVSIELTNQMLVTLFDFPWDERMKMTFWSDVATADPKLYNDVVGSREERREHLIDCLKRFTELWNERVNSEPGDDLISMLAHGDATRNMEPMEYLGNVLLLIIGGNDTTRNSMSGGLYALNLFPEEYDKLQADPSLVRNAVSEIIRWQTPLAHMRRTAARDMEVGGKQIKKGEKVVMWYVSGNFDDEVIAEPHRLLVDRENARRHLSFGFGIHRCVGNRLAEMQLQILWESILERFPKKLEVLEEPSRVPSCFIKGYRRLMVRIPT